MATGISLIQLVLLLLAFNGLVDGANQKGYRCGLPVAKAKFLIVRGKDTRHGSWPWHVALRLRQPDDGTFQYACGGTLISRRFVLTAAHCVVSTNRHQLLRNPSDVMVWAGVFNLSKPEDTLQERMVKKIHIHGYSKESYLHDVALLELTEPVEYNGYVLPACLNEKHFLRAEVGSVVGWGVGDDNEVTPAMKQLSLPVVTESECLKSDPTTFQDVLQNELFCAGLTNGSAPCNGDSGGGLMMLQGDQWRVAGIVSFTRVRSTDSSLCLAESYTAFTNVSAYWNWIQEVTNIDFRSQYNEERDQPCQTPAGQTGTCVPVQQCRDIFNTIRAPIVAQQDADYIAKSICTIDGIERAVCCTDDQIEPLPLHKNAILLPSDCGRSLVRKKPQTDQTTSVLEYPWMAMIRYEKNKKGVIQFCLGTLINNRHVLSMQGCMYKIKRVKIDHVRLGEHTESTDPDCYFDRRGVRVCAESVLDVKVESVIIHPLFDVPLYHNDVALVRLKSEVPFTNSIRPACLPLFSPHRTTNPEDLFVTAWEVELEQPNIYQGELRRYPYKLVTLDECHRKYESIGIIHDPPVNVDRICALQLGPEFNCELTTAAPIGGYVDMDGERFVQFGVWKFAPRNCTSRRWIPAVGFSTGHFLDWILENLQL